jgi:hypothetical protein
MNADTTRTLASAAIVACVAVIVLLAAFGCRDHEAYVATLMLAIMAGFVALTQDD